MGDKEAAGSPDTDRTQLNGLTSVGSDDAPEVSDLPASEYPNLEDSPTSKQLVSRLQAGLTSTIETNAPARHFGRPATHDDANSNSQFAFQYAPDRQVQYAKRAKTILNFAPTGGNDPASGVKNVENAGQALTSQNIQCSSAHSKPSDAPAVQTKTTISHLDAVHAIKESQEVVLVDQSKVLHARETRKLQVHDQEWDSRHQHEGGIHKSKICSEELSLQNQQTIADEKSGRLVSASHDNECNIAGLSQKPSSCSNAVQQDNLVAHQPNHVVDEQNKLPSETDTPVKARPSSPIANKAPGGAPSEEDLLLLLVHRAKKRAKLNSATTARQRSLEDLAQSLEQANIKYKNDLENALNQQASNENENKSLKAKLEKFKAKYDKIKRWAFELNKESSELRKKSNEMAQKIEELTPLKDDLPRWIQNGDMAMNILHHVRNELQKLETASNEASMSNISLKEKLSASDEKLKEERQRNSRLETDIVNLSNKQRQDSAALEFQRHVEEVLLNISQAIENSGDPVDANLQLQQMHNQWLESMQSLKSQNQSSEADVKKINAEIQDIAVNISLCLNATKESSEKILEEVNKMNCTRAVEDIRETMKDLQTSIDESHSSREKRVTLEEKTRNDSRIIALLTKQKEDAETAKDEFRRINQELRDLLSKGREHDNLNKDKVKVTDTVNMLMIKWNTIKSKLAESQSTVLRIQEENNRLTQKVDDMHKALHDSEVKCHVMENDIHRQKQELQHNDSMRVALEKKEDEVQQYELELSTFQTRIKELEIHLQTSQGEVNQLRTKVSKLDVVVEEKSKCCTELNQAMKDIDTLRVQLTKAQQNSKHVDELTRSIAELSQERASLQQNIALAEREAEKLSEFKKRYEEQEANVANLERLEQEKQQSYAQVNALQTENSRLNSTISNLRQDLDAKEHLVEDSLTNEARIQTLNARIAVLEKEAIRAESVSTILDRLKLESQRKDSEIDDLKADLSTLTSHCNKDESQHQHACLTQLSEVFPKSQSSVVTAPTDSVPIETSTPGSKSFTSTLKRAANRAMRKKANPNNSSHHESVSRTNDSQVTFETTDDVLPVLATQLTQDTNIVLDSQRETRKLEERTPMSQIEDDDDLQESSSISLTDLDELFESDKPEACTNSLQQRVFEMTLETQSKASQKERNPRTNADRPPSSSLSDQMLLDQVIRMEKGGDAGSKSKGKDPSPMRLRSGSYNNRRITTPHSESHSISDDDSIITPGKAKERHQPNSAAKRRLENCQDGIPVIQNAKRFKRTPANLEVRPPLKSTAHRSPFKNQTNTDLSVNNLRGSVAGSNMNDSQKSTRPRVSRKSLKKDKYSARFSQDAS